MTTMEEVISQECMDIKKELDYISGIALPARVLRRIDVIRQRVSNIQKTLEEGDPE